MAAVNEWRSYEFGVDPERDRIVLRRFGRLHEKPCADRQTLTCAMPECQWADRCRKS